MSPSVGEMYVAPENAWDKKYAAFRDEGPEALGLRVAAAGALRIAQVIEQRIGPGAYVLEGGSGTGRILTYLRWKTGALGVGVDLSCEGLRLGQRASAVFGIMGAYVAADLTRLPFASAAFDVVYSDSVIEHLGDSRTAVVEMARVLKPGGLLVFTVPNRLRPDGWDLYCRRCHPPYLQRSFTPWQLSRIVREAGLRPHSFFGDTLVLWRNFGWLSAPFPETRPTSWGVAKAIRALTKSFLRRFLPPWLWVDLGVVAVKPKEIS